MKYQVNLVTDDYAEFQKLHASSSRIGPITILVMSFIFIAIGIYALVSRNNIAIILFILYIILIVLFVLISNYIIPRSWKKQIDQDPESKLTLSLELLDNEIMVATEYTSERRPWNKFINWNENDNIILLYVTNIKAMLIPKRWLKEPDIDFIHNKLKENKIPIRDEEAAKKKWMGVVILIGMQLISCILILYSLQP